MDMNTIKNLAFAVILIGSAYLAYVNRERLKRFLAGDSEEKSKPKRKATSSTNAIEEVCQAFLLFADNFQGVFEPLYKASINGISLERKRNVFMEWDIRMGNIGNAPFSLKSWWSTISNDIAHSSDDELQDSAKTAIDMIKKCGIIRDDRKELIVREDTSMYYQQSNGVPLNIGKQIRVESPCWYLPTTPVRVLEKGYCEIV